MHNNKKTKANSMIRRVLKTVYFEASDSYFILKKVHGGCYQTYFQLRGAGVQKFCTVNHVSEEDAMERLSHAIENQDKITVHSIVNRDSISLSKLFASAVVGAGRVVGQTALFLFSPKQNDPLTNMFCYMASPLDDKQQYKLYTFERSKIFKSLHDEKLSFEEAGALVTQICTDFGVQAPKIEKGGLFEKYYDHEENSIVLNTFKPSKHLILHELTHCLLDRLTADSDQTMSRPVFHGSEFVKTALYLYSEYGGLDHRLLTRRAHRVGLIGRQHSNMKHQVHIRMNDVLKRKKPVFKAKS